jgi:hypothetical protein
MFKKVHLVGEQTLISEKMHGELRGKKKKILCVVNFQLMSGCCYSIVIKSLGLAFLLFC